jgi:Mlc titration factor MtfA (ptsG expression regulator)
MKWVDRLRIRHTLRHHPIPYESWHRLMGEADIFRGLTSVECAHLRTLSTLFLHRKAFSGAQGLEVTTDIALAVAAQACLLILKLGLDYYDGWVEIILYPGAFKVSRDVNEGGLVSHDAGHLAGESWQRGPVVLSWATAAADLGGQHSGHNVVVHEFAHKLDSLDGSANGIPPVHSGMIREQWTQVFTDAFDALRNQLEHRHPHAIDAYAATSPAEFFAVCSETFFTAPATLQHQFPAVYEQLVLFYQQDPKTRLSA